MRTWIVGAAALVMWGSSVGWACLPPLETTIRVAPGEDQEVSPDVRFFFSSEMAEVSERTVSLLDARGQEVALDIVRAGPSPFLQYHMVIPGARLEPGTYELIRRAGGSEVGTSDRTRTYQVVEGARVPQALPTRVTWERWTYEEPVELSSCLGPIEELHWIDVTVDHWGGGEVIAHIEFEDERAEVVSGSFLAMTTSGMVQGLEAPLRREQRFYHSRSDVACVTVTPYHASGMRGEAVRTCRPDWCAGLEGLSPARPRRIDHENTCARVEDSKEDPGMEESPMGSWELEEGDPRGVEDSGCQVALGGTGTGTPAVWFALLGLVGAWRRRRV